MLFTMEVVEEKKKAVLSLLEKYEKNMAATTEEDQNTKYKNAFSSLRKSMASALADYVFAEMCVVYIQDPEVEKQLRISAAMIVKENIHPLFDEMKTNGVGGFEETEKKIDKLRETFLDSYYFPMWRKTAVA